MRFKKVVVLIVSFLSVLWVSAQGIDNLSAGQDMSARNSASTLAELTKASQEDVNENVSINVPVYFSLLGRNMVSEVTGPFHASAKTWEIVGVYAVAETGMFGLDRVVQRTAVQMMERNSNFKGVSNTVTGFGTLYEGYTLAALGLYGLVFKNEQLKTTTLLATQACIIGGVMESAIKFVTGRQGPFYSDSVHSQPSPVFRGPSFSLHNDVTFPSGHTTLAFAAATVFATAFHDHPWVPVISYGAATLVGLSRITQNQHWISDVFAGAALGYVTGLTVVYNYHRYAATQKHNNIVRSVSFDLHYNYNHLEPALILALR